MEQSNQPNETFNIAQIIKQKNLVAYFQPIMSVTGKKILGLEGLIRGIIPGAEKTIPPQQLFSAAHTAGLTIPLDRACRDAVLSAFLDYYQVNPDLLLFLNLDTAIIDEVGGSNYLCDQVDKSGISPKNIVIEINESKALNTSGLTQFVTTYKNKGFLIALDDVGAGFSNMDRIAGLKPDIVKIDRSIIKDMDHIYHKQEVFKSLVNLTNKIGALIVAEGVETRSEAIQVLKLGGQVIQGFYFAKPGNDFVLKAELIAKTAEVVDAYKALLLKELDDYNQKCLAYTQTVNGMIKALAVVDHPDEFDGQLTKCLTGAEAVDCAYVLDESGIQCSDTVGAKNIGACEKLVFHSAKMGVDHSIKNFYYNLIKRKQDTYISEPYVSMATGSLCITYSRVFRLAAKKYILCVDFLETQQPLAAQLP
ncbi:MULTISPECIES: EAL domain-containing protein [Acetobacterium]|uniref:Putative membrane protein YjcC n=1 Tax=Acetobacterium wieringae TaxID=52694 RepID=A0A1F2PGG0_9FIRM|nr:MULTISPECIES: EAL domain-containing protein [Acetobacterium]OFV70420.1 putative membrane protein YjcC [Acetobacterium wieringae]